MALSIHSATADAGHRSTKLENVPNAESPSAASDRLRLAELLSGDEPVNWVITGDSITHGLAHTQGERSYPEHLHELIRGELQRTRDIIINSAISGHRIVDILGDFERRVSSWQPHVVTLMIGTNDLASGPAWPVSVEPSEFAEGLRTFVTRARALGAVPVLQTPPPIDVPNAPGRERILAFVEAVREVAASEDTILVDQYARLTEIGNGGVPWGLMDDPFHPNGAGHAALTIELAGALGIRPEPARSRTLPLLEARTRAATRSA